MNLFTIVTSDGCVDKTLKNYAASISPQTCQQPGSVQMSMSSFCVFLFLITSVPISRLTNGNLYRFENIVKSQFSVLGVKKISIKTGTETRSGSDAVATLKICDSLNNCCQTGDLDHPGNDRANGQIDVYEKSFLSDCEQVTFLQIC